MSGKLKIHLKPNERIYVNGAVIRVDRKVAFEFLNDVAFLLEGHVLQVEQATTPLRQLYFIIQSMLIEPSTRTMAGPIFETAYRDVIGAFRCVDILEGLVGVHRSVQEEKYFEALKKLRVLFPLEAQVIEAPGRDGVGAAPAADADVSRAARGEAAMLAKPALTG